MMPDGMIVGRGDEIAAAAAVVDAARRRVPAFLHLEGPAGSGKSTIVDHVVEQYGGRSGPPLDVRRVSVRPGRLRPYGLVSELFGVGTADLAPFDQGRRSLLEAGTSNSTAAVVTEVFVERFAALSAETPVLCVVDDLHRADGRSLAVLAALAAMDDLPLAWLSAGQPADEGSDVAEFCALTIGSPRIVTVSPLGDTEVAAWCRERLGGAPGPALRRSLAEAGGSPLIVDAVLDRLASDQGAAVTRDGDTVDISDDARRDLMRHVPTAVADRVAVAVDTDRAIGAAMALSGADFDLADVAEVLGVGLIDVIGVAERLVRVGLVTSTSTHRFVHEQYRLAAAGLVDAPTRRALHMAFGKVLMARGAPALMVADHLIESSASGERAADWLTRAAQDTVDLDPSAALQLAERAVSMHDGRPSRALALVRARALANVGRAGQSEAIVRRLLVDATTSERVKLRRDLAVVKFQQGLPAETAIELQAAAALAVNEREQARLSAESAIAHLLAADFSTAGRVAEQGSLDGERLGDIGTVLAAEMVGCLVALYAHDLTTAVRLAERLEAFSELPDAADAALYQPWFSASLLRIVIGDDDTARRLDAVGRARSRRAGYLWMVPAYDALDAYVAFNQGDLDDTEATAHAAIAFGLTDSFGANLWCHALLARSAAARGDWERVRRHVADAEALVAPAQAQLGWDHLALASAALAEADGRLAEGYAALCDTWDAFAAFGLDSPRQAMSGEVARLASMLGDDARLGELVEHTRRTAESTGHDLWHADHLVVAAWSERRHGAMIDAAEIFDRFGRGLRAAESLADAALIAEAEGRHDEARRLAADSRPRLEGAGATALAARCAHLVTEPTTRTTVPGSSRLSRSERRVVALVADGLTNSQIAEQLFVSRRTVESHVSAAYRKLGVSNRVELSRVQMHPD